MLCDNAYDSAELREDLHERGTIPNRCNRKQPFSFSKRIYKLRCRIESAFNRLKDFKPIATRYDSWREITWPPPASPLLLYSGFNEAGGITLWQIYSRCFSLLITFSAVHPPGLDT